MSEDSRTDVGGGMNSRYTKEARAVELLVRERVNSGITLSRACRPPTKRKKLRRKESHWLFAPRFLECQLEQGYRCFFISVYLYLHMFFKCI